MRLLFSALIVTFLSGAAHAEGPLRSDVKKEPVYPPAAAVVPAPAAAVVPVAAPAAYAPAATPALPLPAAVAIPITSPVPAITAAPVAVPTTTGSSAPVNGAGYLPPAYPKPVPVPASYAPATATPAVATPDVADSKDAKPAAAVEEVGYDPKVKRDPKGRPVGGSHINPNGNIKTTPSAMPMGRTSDAGHDHKKAAAAAKIPGSTALTKQMNKASKNHTLDDDTRSMAMSSNINSKQSEKRLSKAMGQADKGSDSYSSNLNLNNGNNGAGAMSIGSGMGSSKNARKISLPRSAIPSGGARSITSNHYGSNNFAMPRTRSSFNTNAGRNYSSPVRSSFRTANRY